MKLGDSKAVKTAQWFANEILRNDDINFVGESAYQNITDQLALLFVDELNAGEQDFVVGRGLRLLWDNLLTTNLQIGAAISTKGAYLNADAWGFIADPGGIFSVVVPINQAVAFSAGGTFARIDIIEVRPIEFEYHSVSRNFKDPITGLVSSAIVKTRKEYGYEFAVREGDDTTVLTKEITTFTVNASTVGSDIAGKYILFSTVYDDYYVWYNTGASSDPEISGRTGIAVSIGAADDKDEIALATRTAITVAGVVVSGATNQVILTGSTFANLTDGTNGDMGSFFDAIAITQGNGALLHTAGWIKIAEIDVGASASAITQNDIRNADESDQWENEPNGTRFIRWRAKDMEIEDAEDYLVATKVESAIEELAALVKQNITVAENVDAFDPIGIADSKFYKAKYSLLTSIDQFEPGMVTNGMAIDNLGSNLFVIAWEDQGDSDKGKVRVGEYADGTITWKTVETEFEAGTTQEVEVVSLGSNFFVVAYKDATDSNKGKVRVGEFTGSAISWKTTELEFEAGNTTHISIANLGSDTFVIAFVDVDDTNNGKLRVGEFTGAAVNWSAVSTFDTAVVLHTSIISVENMLFLLIYYDSTSTECQYNVREFTGGSISNRVMGTVYDGVVNSTSLTYLGSGNFLAGYTDNYGVHCRVGHFYEPESKLHWVTPAIEADGISDEDYAFELASLGSNVFAVAYVGGLGNRNSIMIGRYGRGSIEWLIPRNSFVQNPMSVFQIIRVTNLGSNIFAVIYVSSDGKGYCVIGALPLYVGLITETVTSGNSGLLQMKNLLSGMSGLSAGTRYFVDYLTGNISVFGYDEIGKAFSDTKLLLD